MGSVFTNKQSKVYTPLKRKPEQELQKMVCDYLRWQYPNLIFRSDFASGMHLSINQARVHKSLQSGRAWVDMFIYYPSFINGKQYAGLALELKTESTAIVVKQGPRKGHIVSNPHIQEQVLLCKQLSKLGYYATIACGYEQATKVIDWYMGKKELPQESIF